MIICGSNRSSLTDGCLLELAFIRPLSRRPDSSFKAQCPLSLAGGLLTGKYSFGEDPPPGSRLAHAAEIYADYLNAKSFAAIERLRRSAEERQQAMAEAALSFVLDTPGVAGLIIAPRRIEHFASYGFKPE